MKRSLYLQLTNKCDQQCAHCAFNCGPWNSDFMQEDVVNACFKLLDSNYFREVTLGGGEPSLHPSVIDLVMRLNRDYPSIHVGMVTNGTGDITVLKELIRFSEFGNLSIRVSTDRYHKPPNIEVVELIKTFPLKAYLSHPDHTWKPVPMGRGQKLVDRNADSTYCGETGITVSATGAFYPCCCGLSYEAKNRMRVQDVVIDRLCIEAATQYAPHCLESSKRYEEWVSQGYKETLEFLRQFE